MERLAVTVLVLSVFLGLLPHGMDGYLVERSVFEFPANATATNDTSNATKRFGVVTDPTLWFGSLPAGSGSTKFININAPRKTLVQLEAEGNISEHLSYPERLYFKGGKEVAVRFNASKPGYYRGKLTVSTESARRGGGEQWLDFKNWLYSFL